MKMKKKTFEKYYEILTTEKEKVISELRQFDPNELLASQREIAEEMEAANIGVLNAMSVRLNSRKANYLKKVERSLEKLKEGTYGECQDCGCEIEMKRLAIRPTAELCMECKHDQERIENTRKQVLNSGGFGDAWEKEKEV